MENKTKTFFFYGTVLLVICLIFVFARYVRPFVMRNGYVSSCIVDDVRSVGRENITSIRYHFSINGAIISEDAAFNNRVLTIDSAERLIDRSFPLIYQKKFGMVFSDILILPKDFEDHNLPFPDSLKWILPLFESTSG